MRLTAIWYDRQQAADTLNLPVLEIRLINNFNYWCKCIIVWNLVSCNERTKQNESVFTEDQTKPHAPDSNSPIKMHSLICCIENVQQNDTI